MSINEINQDQPASTVYAQPDYYASHLARINEQREVVSADDICNVHGVVLVRKGARIDSRAAAQLLRHRLTKPLDQQITIAGELKAQQLQARAGTLFEKYDDLRTMHEALGADHLWRVLTQDTELPTLLMQKLTVLEHDMPEEFERTIFSAWLSALIARELGMESSTVQSAFLAGLGRDVGLLHIDPDIVNKTGALRAEEWRAIQSHVVIGKLFMEGMPGVRLEVAQAILEHHERCDGAGYPTGKSERELGVLGQIVGLADSMQAIRIKQFQPAGRNLYDALPYLRLNAYTHSYAVFRAMDSLIKRADLRPSGVNPYGDFDLLVMRLQGRGKALQRIVTELDAIHQELTEVADTERAEDLLKSLDHARAMMDSSGLVRDELFEWMDGLKVDKDAHALGELSEIDLMLNELRWQLRHLLHAFDDFCDKEREHETGVCALVKLSMEKLVEQLA